MEADKLLYIGIGLVLGGLIVLPGVTIFKYFPTGNKKNARIIGASALVLGIVIIITVVILR